MSIFKKPYEISLWEDRLTFVDGKLNEYELSVPNDVTVATSYYRERKICTIGADSFDAPTRAINPQLKRNINGSNSLTFSLYAKYYDEGQEKLVDNPFIKYLTNERKVKLKYIEKGEVKWLDFVIKGITENSETYLYSYTAQDAFVNELSKTGFSLVFDEKLNNNAGNVQQLGEKIVEGTDWRIGEETEIIQQKQQEALYRVKLNQDINAYKVDDANQESPITLSAGSVIYTFYSCVSNKVEDFFQFLYREDGVYNLDENGVIINADEYFVDLRGLKLAEETQDWPYLAFSADYANEFRGERMVRQQSQIFDNVLQQYVYAFEDESGEEVYGYSDVTYVSPQLVRSYVSNPTDFSSTAGWKQKDIKPIESAVFPSFWENTSPLVERTYALKYSQTENNFLFNSGISDNSFYIKEFALGEEYLFRIKAKQIHPSNNNLIDSNCIFKVVVKSYTLNNLGHFQDVKDDIVLFQGQADILDGQGYMRCKMICKTSITQEQLNSKKFGIFIQAFDTAGNIYINDFYITDMQFYRYVKDNNGNECLPEGKVIEIKDGKEVITDNFQTTIETRYYYYRPKQEVASKDQIEYLHIGDKNEEKYCPRFNQNYEKIRSIAASGSNRFNLLQTLAETFECWCRFDVKHKPNGEIMLFKDLIHETIYDAGSATVQIDNNKDNFIDAGNSLSIEVGTIDVRNYRIEELYYPLKFITFHKNIGQINDVDFVYGINLKSISRNLESNNLVTKLIVKTNNNQFAQDGGCDISRAKENPTGGNILYNFDQYISQGLLNGDNFNNDLYSLDASKGWLGFYSRLKTVNSQIQELNSNKNALLASRSNLTSQHTTSQLLYEETTSMLRDKEEDFYVKTTYHFDVIPSDSLHLKENSIVALAEDILRLRSEAQTSRFTYLMAEIDLSHLEIQLDRIQEQLSILTEYKANLIASFENKYSRFIQEGPWTSENYTDDELYYLDAESTLRNSAQPKVQYTINVIEVSTQEGYEHFAYSLGDITHIQDTEFFGWTIKNGRKTPYKEKIVVTETITNFDSPEKDTIKVQNYRTQFEDLFQRMAAATQQVEFYSGAYERAASVVKTDGSIAPEALEDVFSANTSVLRNANNQSVQWDDKGIRTTSTKNPAEIVRIVSGGIFISNDGGNTWTTGITGEGINAKTITTGQLNTGLITIYNGDQPAFRWDVNGISAYKQESNGQYNNKTYVRFDQYGLYGIKNQLDTPDNINKIWENASFSLTWRGFKLKTNDGNGSVTIDTENDFVVFNEENIKIIQIGRIEDNIKDNSKIYGIIIKDPNLLDTMGNKGEVVFKASQEGLFVGGWKITKDAFLSPDLNDDGYPEIGIYSSPVTEVVNFGEETMGSWRMLARNASGNDKQDQINFGLDTNGNVYARGLNVLGSLFIKTNQFKEDQSSRDYWEIELNDRGITATSYRDGISQTQKMTISWIDILRKLAT